MRDIVIKIIDGLFVGIAFIFPSFVPQSAEAQSDFSLCNLEGDKYNAQR